MPASPPASSPPSSTDTDVAAAVKLFPALACHVADVRRFIAGNAAGHPAADDAVTAGNELAANAVQHSGGTRFSVTVTITRPGVLRLEVADAGISGTRPHIPARAGETGRGLAIVASLAYRWGYDSRTGDLGAVTWCEFTARPLPVPRQR